MSERRFVSEPLAPDAGTFDPNVIAHGEPALPRAFRRRDERLEVERVVRSWRTTKIDRGDAYLARHYFEVELAGGARAVVYFDRQARRGAPRWWLYSREAAAQERP